MPPYPDEPLPVLNLSLKEFNEKAYQLLNYSFSNRVDPMHHKFVNFVLAGRYQEHHSPDEHRVYIDIHKNTASTADLEGLQITRDYDSVIGITDNLPFRLSIAIYPLPNFALSLKKSNHLMRTISTPVSITVLPKRLL